MVNGVVTISRPPTISSLKKSQIAHSDMHHPVSGRNSLIHSVGLASHVSTHLLIHLSAHICHHRHSHYPSCLHSFTPGSNVFNVPFQHFFYTLDCLHESRSRDQTGLIMLLDLFLFRFFNFFCLTRVVD